MEGREGRERRGGRERMDGRKEGRKERTEGRVKKKYLWRGVMA
jgi:hypothetical protein